MFKIIILILACAFSFKICSFAQSYKTGNVYGFTANVGERQFAASLSWTHYYGKRFKIGYGARLTSYFGSEQNYITAPAKYTSGKSSIAALFSENIEKNLDTISFTFVQVNSLNAGIYLSYTLPFLQDRLDFGINIDAIGFSLSQKQGGTFTSGKKSSAVSAKPSPFNLLLISDSDLGSLNSEWYLRYWLNKKWTIKAGYEFLFTEYTTDNKVQKIPDSLDTNDKFRNKSRMFMIGIQYAPFRN